MDVIRREFVKLVGTVISRVTIAGIGAGGYHLLTNDDESSDESDAESSDSGGVEQEANQSTDHPDTTENSTQEPENETMNESTEATENETANESDQTGDEQEEEEKPLTPEDTEHSGEYNESRSGTMRETVPRSRDEVKISNRSATMNNRGGVTYTANVTNTSGEPIDVVEVYIDYLVNGEYVYGDSDSVTNLGPGGTAEISSAAPASQVGGVDPGDITVEISEINPYDYASSGE